MSNKKFDVTWQKLTTKDYMKEYPRITLVEAPDELTAKKLIYSRFGNEKRVEIIEVIEKDKTDETVNDVKIDEK